METYCLKCRKYTKTINPEISSTSNGKTMTISKCVVCKVENVNLLKNKKQKDIK